MFYKGSVCRICGCVLSGSDYIKMNNNNEEVNVCKSCTDEIVHIRNYVAELENDIEECKTLEEKKSKSIADDQLKPIEIKAILDKYIVGQEQAKKVLSVACYNHYKRSVLQDKSIKKSNVLMIGPTGSGKSYLVEILAKILDVPLAMATATTLTEAGYIGDDVESVIKKLLDAAGGDIKKAERGIVFIDEIDKLSSRSSDTEKKVGGKGVQQALLPLLEGTIVSVPKTGMDATNLGFKVNVDTSGILFICAGAFPEAEQIIRARLKKKATIGFTSRLDMEDYDESNILMKITSDDLREFGLIPEFIGRLPVIVTLESMSKELLKKILIEPQDSLVTQYQNLLKFDNVSIHFDEEALDLIAEKALKKGTGARSLRNIMEELLLDIMFYAPSSNLSELHITKAFIENKDKVISYGNSLNRVLIS